MLTNNGKEIKIGVSNETYTELEKLANKAGVSVDYFCQTIVMVCIEDNLLDGIMDFHE